MKTLTHFLFLTLLLVIGFSPNIMAQSKQLYTVKGLLKDSVSQQPEPYATLRITVKGQTKPVAMGLTAKDGTFSLRISAKGNYVLVASAVGKSPAVKNFSIDTQKPVDVGTLFLGEKSGHLKEVEVVAAKPLIKADIDKIEYNIADDPDSQTKTILDMLRKVPMVTVDGDDNIKVNGSTGFKVYVNGKPNSMMSKNPKDVLKNFPANSVKKIEVVTDPGAKYDAEGVAGVLNIITDTRTKMSGYNVSLSTIVGNRQYGGSLYSTVQYGKLMLSMNYGVGHFTLAKNTSDSETEYLHSDDNHYLISNSGSKPHGLYQYGNLEGSYEIDSLNLVSFSAGLWGNSYFSNETGLTQMFNINNNPVYRYAANNQSNNHNVSVNAGLDYQRSFKNRKGELLTFSYRLSTSPAKEKYETSYSDLWQVPDNLFLADIQSDVRSNFEEHTGQVDYTLPWKKEMHTLSVGSKFTYRLNKSDSNEMSRSQGETDFTRNEEQSVRYRHRNTILAAYAEYKLNLKRVSLKTGVRYEYSYIKVSYPDGKEAGFHSGFSDIVPSASLGFKLTDTQNLVLGYNMRIGRPGIYWLNPYVVRENPTYISYGNPNLGTEKGHNLKLSYSFVSTKFSINTWLNYSFSNNQMASYTFLDKNNVLNKTYGNIVRWKGGAYGLYMNWMMTKTTTFNVNGSVGYDDYRSNQLGQHKGGWNVYAYAGIQQKLPLNFRLSLNGGGSTDEINLQGTGSGYYYYSLTLAKSMLKEDRLTLTAYVSNPFPHRRVFSRHTATNDFVRYSSVAYKNFNLGLSVRLRIGKLQATVKKAERAIQSEDAKSSGGGASQGGMGK